MTAPLYWLEVYMTSESSVDKSGRSGELMMDSCWIPVCQFISQTMGETSMCSCSISFRAMISAALSGKVGRGAGDGSFGNVTCNRKKSTARTANCFLNKFCLPKVVPSTPRPCGLSGCGHRERDLPPQTLRR